MKKYQVLDDAGVWHDIDGFQYAALRCDGVPKENLRVKIAECDDSPVITITKQGE